MSLNDVKKELRKLDNEKLIDLITELYKKSKEAKEFLDYSVNPDKNGLLSAYKEKVYEAFFPKRGGYRPSTGKKAISDFKKLESSKELLAELMLYYVETGVKFTNKYGDVEESIYHSISSTFQNTLTVMAKERILDRFAERAKKIAQDTHYYGYGIGDEINDIYSEFYN
jgi:hypothetical protein